MMENNHKAICTRQKISSRNEQKLMRDIAWQSKMTITSNFKMHILDPYNIYIALCRSL